MSECKVPKKLKKQYKHLRPKAPKGFKWAYVPKSEWCGCSICDKGVGCGLLSKCCDGLHDDFTQAVGLECVASFLKRKKGNK